MTRYGRGLRKRRNGKGKGFRIWVLGPRRFVVDVYDRRGDRTSCMDYLPSLEAAVAWIQRFVVDDRRRWELL